VKGPVPAAKSLNFCCFSRTRKRRRVARAGFRARPLYRCGSGRHSAVMAILKIARMGHPVLRRRAAPVEDPTDPEIRRLVADMLETMQDADGTGLAAPQVHVSRRIVVFYVAAERTARERDAGPGEAPGDSVAADNGLAVPLTVLVNPVVEPLTEETALGWEACLSVPDLAGKVPRYTAVRYRGLGLDGREIVREAQGFHARVVQHECDHLDGILYPQRMTDLATLTFTSELRATEAAESAGAGAGAGAGEQAAGRAAGGPA